LGEPPSTFFLVFFDKGISSLDAEICSGPGSLFELSGSQESARKKSVTCSSLTCSKENSEGINVDLDLPDFVVFFLLTVVVDHGVDRCEGVDWDLDGEGGVVSAQLPFPVMESANRLM
jgi:hypothetical protein